MSPSHYFDEATAQRLWRAGDIDGCIVYALCCVPPIMARARVKYPYATQWDDMESEYRLNLVLAIQRYNPKKKAKLFTWITWYLWGAESHFIRKEAPYFQRHVQLSEIGR